MAQKKHKFESKVGPITKEVEESEVEELQRLQEAELWRYVGKTEVKRKGPNVQPLPDESDDSGPIDTDSIKEDRKEEELAEASRAFRDHAKRSNSPSSVVFEELADEIEENNDLSDIEEESESSNVGLRQDESWSDFKVRMRENNVSVGEMDSRTKRELKDLKKASRMRKGKGHNSTALAEHLEEKASRLLDEADDSHPSDKIKDESVNVEMAQAAAEAFRDRANSPDGSDAWEEVAEELEQKSTNVETQVFPDLEGSTVTHHTDGSATVKTEHQGVREELQSLMSESDVARQISDVEGELTVEIDDPDEAIEELEEAM
ncbi:hypothetical protein [Halobellus rarus]|uniref:Uncharacterized protein n=1 Tax=Halobellus rarus TaxID=1126237 RepID=A0ABD6CLL8_9EURY|nr:hypothetical protein [Halobellus rarus]